MRKKRRLIILAIIITIFIGVSISLIMTYSKQKEWPKIVEHFYKENKDTLNNFIELCYENEITYIGENDYTTSKGRISTLINGYYVFSITELNEDIINKLSEIFILYSKFMVHDIYINGENEKATLFGMGDNLNSVALCYTQDAISIRDIKEKSFYDDVWYIDDNWYIGVGD